MRFNKLNGGMEFSRAGGGRVRFDPLAGTVGVSAFSSGSSSSFNPATYGTTLMWLDAGQETAYADGDPVQIPQDRSLNGNTPSQATLAQRPLWKANVVNGRGVFRFDAVDDSLAGTLPGINGNPPTFTVVMRSAVTPFGTYSAVVEWDQFGSGYRFNTYFENGGTGFLNAQALLWKNGAAVADGKSVGSIDSFFILTFTVPAGPTGIGYRIGLFESSYALNSDVAEFIAHASAPSNIAAMHAALAVKYRIVTDSDAHAFLAAAAITNHAIRWAIGQLVTDLKAANLWSSQIAIYPFAGGTAASHSRNLVNPSTYQITWSGTVAHSANGIQGDGATGFGTCVGLSSSLAAAGSIAFGVYVRTNANQSSSEFATTSYTSAVYTRYADGNAYFDNDNFGRAQVAVSATPGLFASSRVSTTDHQGYRNGVSICSTTSLSHALNTDAFSICGNSGALSVKPIAFAFLSTGLTPAQNATLYTIIQAYQTALGRQV